MAIDVALSTVISFGFLIVGLVCSHYGNRVGEAADFADEERVRAALNEDAIGWLKLATLCYCVTLGLTLGRLLWPLVID